MPARAYYLVSFMLPERRHTLSMRYVQPPVSAFPRAFAAARRVAARAVTLPVDAKLMPDTGRQQQICGVFARAMCPSVDTREEGATRAGDDAPNDVAHMPLIGSTPFQVCV